MTGRSRLGWTTIAALTLAALVPPAAAQPKAGDAWEDPKLHDLGMAFRHIPNGSFEMGSPTSQELQDTDEAPRTVTLTRSFRMTETEVTQGQWKAIMENNPSAFENCGDACPVEIVNWYEAVAFANALSKRSGQEECYVVSGDNGKKAGEGLEYEKVSFKGLDCAGYRLPTEAEWEYAARAGTTTTFWTGDHITTDQANYNGTYPYAGYPTGEFRKTPMPVRSFDANPWGLYEILGNVMEWVGDWYGPYPAEAAEDPLGPAEGSLRVFRGGSWRNIARYCRAADRGAGVPGLLDNGRVGFRLVRTSP